MTNLVFKASHGNYPTHWKISPFEDAFKDTTGGNVKLKQSEYQKNGSIPIIDQGQDKIAGYVDDPELCCEVTLPVILFGDHTKIFKFVSKPFVLGADGVKVLVPCPELNVKFGYYYLKTVKLPDNAGYSRHYKFLKEVLVPVPPLDEQRRIAAILDKADAIRLKRQESIRLTEEFLRSTFLEMFGDPVKNPKGWQTNNLGNICKKITDGTHDTPKRLSFGMTYITGKHIKPFFIDFGKCDYVSIEDHNEIIKRCKPERGDVLYTNIGANVGTAALNHWDNTFSMKNVALLKPNRKIILPKYLEFVLNHPGMKQKILGSSSVGGAQQFLSLTQINQIMIPVPTHSIQEKFEEIMIKASKLTDQSNHLLIEKIHLFNSLTQHAFCGELS